jgi:AraC-like DNA-binding protein
MLWRPRRWPDPYRGGVSIRVLRVPDLLRPYVRSLVAYDEAAGAPDVHIGMPSTSLTLVLPLDEPLDVGWTDDPGSRARRWSTVSGLHSRPAEIHRSGGQRGLQLALTTAGSRALLGVPAGEIAREIVEVGDVTPTLGALPERLAAEATWDRRLHVVETALMTALADRGAPGPRAEVGHALARLTRGASVQDVADEVGYSRRHLTSLVASECGLGPKEYQRLARFERSHRLLDRTARSGAPSLAAIAADAGYADQGHLTREWRWFAGCTPRYWLRTEFPFLQDLAPGDDAD